MPEERRSNRVRISNGRRALENTLARANDDISARTHGHYGKWNLNVLRQQSLTSNAYLFVSLAAQQADKNLGSLEKFILGGVTVNEHPFAVVGAVTANRRHLADSGAGVTWAKASDFQVRLIASRRVRSSPDARADLSPCTECAPPTAPRTLPPPTSAGAYRPQSADRKIQRHSLDDHRAE